MRSLKDYNIPEAILKIETKLTPQEIATLMDESTALESSEDDYVKAFTKMLHFEEATESRYLIQFNTKNIELRNVRGREYCIENNVSAITTTTAKFNENSHSFSYF